MNINIEIDIIKKKQINSSIKNYRDRETVIWLTVNFTLKALEAKRQWDYTVKSVEEKPVNRESHVHYTFFQKLSRIKTSWCKQILMFLGYWLWWWFYGCIFISKLIKLYALIYTAFCILIIPKWVVSKKKKIKRNCL